jgi:prefoldin subunit 5
MMPKLSDVFAREARLLRQQREIQALHREIETLQAKIERMQAGMRRCVPCEYRLEVVARRAESRPG